MGLPKRFVCPAGVWTTVISKAFAQLPASFDVRISSSEGGPVEGVYEEKKSRWILPGKPLQGSLAARMMFERGYWNTFHSVKVRPMSECVVEVA